MILIVLVIILLAIFFIPGSPKTAAPCDKPRMNTPIYEDTVVKPARKKKVHFAETRDERIYDKKSRKILRDTVGKT